MNVLSILNIAAKLTPEELEALTEAASEIETYGYTDKAKAHLNELELANRDKAMHLLGFSSNKLDTALADFRADRQLYHLGELVENGNEAAKSYAECLRYDPKTTYVYGYPLTDPDEPELFITLDSSTAVTLNLKGISHCEHIDKLEALEAKLFYWAHDNGLVA